MIYNLTVKETKEYYFEVEAETYQQAVEILEQECQENNDPGESDHESLTYVDETDIEQEIFKTKDE